MKVAIVHYHLGQGGVSEVIATTSQALSRAGVKHVILVGETTEVFHEHPLPVKQVEGLAYLTNTGDLTAEMLATRLRMAAQDALGQAPDVWHFHNHSLGKNVWMAEVVASFAEANECLLLQIHDLAEDGRPANYQMVAGCAHLYPVSGRVAFGFLNSRDRRVFLDAGLDASNSVTMGNPVAIAPSAAPPASEWPIVFYPVRGIRRKNAGELVFLSALAPQGARFAISRAPVDPAALEIHDRWSRFARRQGYPIEFDVVDRFAPAAGTGAGFESWMAHATHLASTSVMEGYGMVFAEAAALGKPLLGRIPVSIAADVAARGIPQSGLYDQLLVPTEWIDTPLLRDHLAINLERNHRAYGLGLKREQFEETLQLLDHEGWLDFGNLPEALQQGAIERLGDPGCRRVPLVKRGTEMRPAFEWLAEFLAKRIPEKSHQPPLSPDCQVKELVSIYQDLRGRPVGAVSYLQPAEILAAYTAPQSFHFLLSAPKPDVRPIHLHRAVVFDVYGTLLIAPAGGVKPDPEADPLLRRIILGFGHTPPDSPSSALHDAVIQWHAKAQTPNPEVDLRVLWRELLGADEGTDMNELVLAIEEAWHPSLPMPGAAEFVQKMSRRGLSLGLLSNAQCNTLTSLGGLADLFAPELTILSYQQGIAKPAPALFEMLVDRLAGRGIPPEDTLFIGNDPKQDIAPAAALGFKTALFTGHPDSLRDGGCMPDFVIRDWAAF